MYTFCGAPANNGEAQNKQSAPWRSELQKTRYPYSLEQRRPPRMNANALQKIQLFDEFAGISKNSESFHNCAIYHDHVSKFMSHD